MLHTFGPYVLMAVGLTLVLYALINSDKKAKLRDSGLEAEGIVFDVQNQRDYTFENEIMKEFQDRSKNIIVRFVTNKLEWVTAPIDQDFQMFYTWQYSQGDKVKVFYDPENPNNFYVDTKQSVLVGRLSLIASGAGMAVAGYYQIAHLS